MDSGHCCTVQSLEGPPHLFSFAEALQWYIQCGELILQYRICTLPYICSHTRLKMCVQYGSNIHQNFHTVFKLKMIHPMIGGWPVDADRYRQILKVATLLHRPH